MTNLQFVTLSILAGIGLYGLRRIYMSIQDVLANEAAAAVAADGIAATLSKVASEQQAILDQLKSAATPEEVSAVITAQQANIDKLNAIAAAAKAIDDAVPDQTPAG